LPNLLSLSKFVCMEEIPNRVAMIRKGNEYFNAGHVKSAKKLFIAANYTDGMIRIADYYYEQKQPVDALLLYRRAGCREQVEEIYESIAGVIRSLLNEDKQNSLARRFPDDQ